MKQQDIKKCCLCDQGVMHSGQLTFYRLKIERMVINVPAVQRQHGLEQVVGSPAIALAMGQQEDLAATFAGPHEVFICEMCASTSPRYIAPFFERIDEEAADA